MLLINKEKLSISAADNPSHPQHKIAKFYLDGTRHISETYGRYMRFIDPRQPRHTRGADSRGNEIPKMKEPDTITKIPLKASYYDKDRGTEIWACCLGDPILHPNGQYDLGNTRAITITSDKVVDTEKDMDLAFYLAYISPFVRKKVIKIDDPKMDAKKLGDIRRAEVERQMAIWNMLTDEDKLKTMAQAYGVPNVNQKEPDIIRMELEKILLEADKRKKVDFTVRGTKEFLEEMKVKDNVILRSFIQQAIDDKTIVYKLNGNWEVGQKIILKVPQSDIERRFDYLCNYLGSSNNTDKLKDLLGDIVNSEYIENANNYKVIEWIARVNGINTTAKSKDNIKGKLTEIYGSGTANSQ